MGEAAPAVSAREILRARVAVQQACRKSSDLLPPALRARIEASAHWSTGYCYVASEVLRILLGDTWKPEYVRHEGVTHWYLRGPTGRVLDVTADQFVTVVPYERGRPCEFLTRDPSAGAVKLLRRMG